MEGFWLMLVKLLGPVQEKVVPMFVVPIRLRVCPVHAGLLLDAEAVGLGYTFKVNSGVVADIPLETQVITTI